MLLYLNSSWASQFHSIETALLKVQSDILMAMYNHEITFLVLLDLSATIDYHIHLNVLKMILQLLL